MKKDMEDRLRKAIEAEYLKPYDLPRANCVTKAIRIIDAARVYNLPELAKKNG